MWCLFKVYNSVQNVTYVVSDVFIVTIEQITHIVLLFPSKWRLGSGNYISMKRFISRSPDR